VDNRLHIPVCVYTHICIHTYKYTRTSIHLNVHIYTNTHEQRDCGQLSIYAHVHIYTNTHEHIHTWTHFFTSMKNREFVDNYPAVKSKRNEYMYMHIYICICKSMYVFTYTYIYRDTHEQRDCGQLSSSQVEKKCK